MSENVRESQVIASSLSGNELAGALSELVAMRWDNYDLSPFMLYLVDVCVPAALPYLADQFDVDGLRGFAMVVDEEQQRELIKQSISLHKYMGTPWAIREACNTIGFPVILLEEGATIPGAATTLDDWAQFRILIEAATNRYITAEEARKLRQFVEYYKNERSHLIELGFYQSLIESNLFRLKVEERDQLNINVITLELAPNLVTLNPRGDKIKVIIRVNTSFIMPVLIYWGDGTNDKVNITYSGMAGTSEINIVSDPNITGSDREITTAIENPIGIVLGSLTIRQWCKWRNAYSWDYNQAYNQFSPMLPYIELNRQTVWLEDTADFDEQIKVKSNTDWKVE